MDVEKEKLDNPSWSELIKKCAKSGIDLSDRYWLVKNTFVLNWTYTKIWALWLLSFLLKVDIFIKNIFWRTKPSEYPESYDIWGAIATEVQLDVLTGQYVVS